MRKLLLLLSVSLPSWGACASSWANGYDFCRMITVDHTKVPNTDQTNFVVGISAPTLNLDFLDSVANGGESKTAGGLDILFTSDNAGATPLNFERANYTATSGSVKEFWVQKTLSHTVDTVFYLFTGKASVSDPSHAALTWSGAGYANVYHFGNGSSLTLTDSVGGVTLALPGTTHNPTATAGYYGGAAAFVGASTQYLTGSGYAGSGVQRTVEVWEKTTTAGFSVFVDNRDAVGASPAPAVFIDPGKTGYLFCNGGGAGNPVTGATAIGDGNWHTLVAASNLGANSVVLYADGTSQGTITGNYCNGSTVATYGFAIDLINYPLTGTIDEIRFRDGTTTSADWAATEKNNNTQGTFLTIGSPLTPSGGVPRRH